MRIGPPPVIAVDHTGEGELVVFLHGIGGNKRNWHDNLPAFAADFHAAAWDARGYGESEDYDGPLAFTDFRSDLVRVLDHFGAQKAHIVGLSMGGRIAASFHEAHADRVASLVLCDTHLGFANFSDEARQKFVSLRRDPLLNGKTPADIAPTVARTLIGDPNDAEALAKMVDSMERLHTQSYIKSIEASVALDHTDLYRAIRVPTLVVVGALDRLTPPDMAREIAGQIEGSRLEVIEGAGHLPNFEKADAFNRIVLDFLRSVSAHAAS